MLDAAREYLRDIKDNETADSLDLSYDKNVLGRLFVVDGNLVMAFWQTHNQLKKIGLSKILPILKRVIGDEGFNIKNVLFNPYMAGKAKMDKTMSYDEFVHGEKTGDEDDTEQQRKDRILHLLSVADKKKALQKMGAKPKVGDTPEWMRKQAAGIDENLGLTDRTKSRQELKDLLMSMIKTGVIKAYNQKLTSGETIPEDFADELATKLQVGLEKELNQVNWISDKYIRAGIE